MQDIVKNNITSVVANGLGNFLGLLIGIYLRARIAACLLQVCCKLFLDLTFFVAYGSSFIQYVCRLRICPPFFTGCSRCSFH